VYIKLYFKTPAAARWVCFEPLLDRVMPEAVPAGDGYFDTLAGGHYTIDGRGRAVAAEGPAWQSLDWVVAGGEIGVGARPTHPDWLRALRDQCISAGVAFFFRQWGDWVPAPGERPAQTVVRVGKRAAGRLLDGAAGTGCRELHRSTSNLGLFRIDAPNPVLRAPCGAIFVTKIVFVYTAYPLMYARAAAQRKTDDRGRRCGAQGRN
jgi:Protein of unknown function (DUF5131)